MDLLVGINVSEECIASFFRAEEYFNAAEVCDMKNRNILLSNHKYSTEKVTKLDVNYFFKNRALYQRILDLGWDSVSILEAKGVMRIKSSRYSAAGHT